MTDAPLISVCSPVHNEEGNLAALVGRMRQTLDARFAGRWEYVLVDDGSGDSSNEILKRLAAEFREIRVVEHERNRGERAAWSTAFAAARGDIVVLLAADLQSPPEDVPALIDVVLVDGYDVGTGLRRRRQDDPFYSAATFVLTCFTRVVFGVPAKDVSSSFFAVRRRFVTDLPLIENDHRYILPILHRRGASIREIPIHHYPRVSGQSHYRKSKVLRGIPELLRFSLRLFRGYYTEGTAISGYP